MLTRVTQKRALGTTEVSATGFGCMSLSNVYGASDDGASVALIREALDLGVTMLDTSDMYGFGHNEEVVGRSIAGRRAEVFLATKFGYVPNPSEPGRISEVLTSHSAPVPLLTRIMADYQ